MVSHIENYFDTSFRFNFNISLKEAVQTKFFITHPFANESILGEQDFNVQDLVHSQFSQITRHIN